MKKKAGVKRCIAAALSVGLLMGSVIGCQKKETETAKSSESTGAVVRSGELMTAIPVPVDYADKQGWYDELDIVRENILFSNGPSVNEAVGAGEIDIYTVGAMPGILGGIAYDSKIIGWLEDDDMALQIYARKDHPIVLAGKGNLSNAPDLYGTKETWEDAKIIVASATSSHYCVNSVLGMFGLDDTDVQLVDMEGTSGAAAFLAGEGDLYCSWDPQWSEFANDPENYVQVAACAMTDKSFICVLMASEEYCQNNEDEIVKYLEGVVRACDSFAKDDNTYYGAMYDWMSEYSEVTENEARKSAEIRKMYDLEGLKTWHTNNQGSSKLEDTIWEITDFMVSTGLIEASDKQDLADAGFIDTSYMLKAIDNVEKEK